MADTKDAAPATIVKDRSNISAWTAFLEGVCVVLLRDKLASLASDAERSALMAAIKAQMDEACADTAVLAPTIGKRRGLSPPASKLKAAEIKDSADYLFGEFMLQLMPPAASPGPPKK